jgi:hypothetical protein
MRRIVPLATTLLLSGCAGSGFFSYLGDTFTVPFHDNPNMPAGSSETYTKVRAGTVNAPPPILYEGGDVWPPPPVAPPTLKDLQAQQSRELNNGSSRYVPQKLPDLPGYQAPEPLPHANLPKSSFPAGAVPTTHGRSVTTGGGTELKTAPGGAGNIIVPNGNGTSTVIGPTGTVTTIPTPGK